MSAHVQTTGEQSFSAGTTHTLAYAGNVTVGSLLLAFVRENNNVSAVSDNLNGAWTELIDTDNTVVGLNVWYFNGAAAGATTVTVTTTAGQTIRYIISEYSGVHTVSPFEDSDVALFTTTTTPATGTVTTIGANRLVAGCVASNLGTTIAPRNGETERQEIDTRLQVQDKAAATAGNYDSQWTFGTTQPGISVALVLAPAVDLFVKVLASADAAGATGIEGVVLNAARDTVIGEFSGQAFEADLESGEAVLLIAANDITPDGSTLTTADTPLVFAYNATDSLVGPASATVIEV